MLYCISGKPHCGKSTFLKEIVEKLNIKCYIITEEILDKNNNRIGFKTIINDNNNIQEFIIASIFNKEWNINLGKYFININNINIIAHIINDLYKKYNELIIDEIASIQLLSYDYALMIQKILFTYKIFNKKIIFTASIEINDKINNYIKLNVHDKLIDLSKQYKTYYYLPYDIEKENKEVFKEYPKILNKFINNYYHY